MKELLFKPFEKYSENKLLLVGIVFSVIGLFIGDYFNASFDGVLDLHFEGEISLLTSFIYWIIDIGCILLTLYLAAKMINQKTRMIDLFGTVLIARIPLVLLPLFNIGNKAFLIGEELIKSVDPIKNNTPHLIFDAGSVIFLATMSIVLIAMIVWYVALLFNGYKTASNAKGTKSIVLFILAILIAEIGSKLLIGLYNR